MKIGYADELIMRARRRQTNQRKRQPQIFFGLNILSVAHALQLGGLPCSLAPSLKLPTRQFFYARPPQTVMLTFILRFATSKQLPQNSLQPCPDSYRDFFGYFLFIKKKKVTLS